MPACVIPILLLLTAGALIALSLVWPQGLGEVSPQPFGHPLAPIAAPASATNERAHAAQTPR
ncbi:MAG: hypothetical protein ABI056_05900 [Caulobacteraceae bacterium]